MHVDICNSHGGTGVGSDHDCRCIRAQGHPLDSDRPHGCSCGAMWLHQGDVLPGWKDRFSIVDLVVVLRGVFTDTGVLTWLTSPNSNLSYSSPALYINDGRLDEVYEVACKLDRVHA
jgi:hypothetical protein